MNDPHAFPPGDDEPLAIDPSMLHPEVDFEKGIRVFPPVSVALMVACAAAFVAQVAGGALDSVDRLVEVGALDPASVARGEVWRLVSAMFLHGGADHLIGNLMMLVVLGMACEHAYGRGQFLALYVFAGVTGSLFSLTAGRVSVGASGAIFGLGGAIVVFFWRHRHQLHLRDKRIGVVLGIWAAYQIALGALTPGVDNLAHLGGLLGGAALGLVLQPALLIGRAEAAAHPVARAGLISALFCLAATAFFFVPRLLA
jgi:rhomboid protease GluP